MISSAPAIDYAAEAPALWATSGLTELITQQKRLLSNSDKSQTQQKPLAVFLTGASVL